ncbi:hypothetical protein KKG31_01495 [Patescibacteria group bacterium]|nr:hypothetical protein [Patescibacteria group bacterium]MBU1757852.1 hypothetical protein [Patescibacteria group bacterium]
MKTKLLLIIFVLSFAAFNSCKKEEMQPRFPKYIFLEQLRDYVYDKAFPIADRERSIPQPSGYDFWTDSLYRGFEEVWNDKILSELDAFTGTVNTAFREGPDRWTAGDAYNHVKAGFHPHFYSFSPDFCEGLHEMIRNYVLNVIDGDPEWSAGEAQESDRQAILNFLSKVDPDNKWEMTYGDIIKAGIHDYVVTGDMPDNELNGWFIFTAEKKP